MAGQRRNEPKGTAPGIRPPHGSATIAEEAGLFPADLPASDDRPGARRCGPDLWLVAEGDSETAPDRVSRSRDPRN